MPYRVIEYTKMDGEIRDIYTDTKTYPPQYFIAKYLHINLEYFN